MFRLVHAQNGYRIIGAEAFSDTHRPSHTAAP